MWVCSLANAFVIPLRIKPVSMFQRFPRDVSSEFEVIVYFSVLCPIQQDGMPPTGIEYHELKMKTISKSIIVVKSSLK